MENANFIPEKYIASLISRAKAAQEIACGFDQKQVDTVCAAIAWEACKEDFCRKAAAMLVEESNMGFVEGKMNKIRNKTRGVWYDMKDEISVGIVKRDLEKKLVTYIKPVGVLGSLVPVTNGEATPIVQAMWAVKARNAIVFSPHPHGKATCEFVVEFLRNILKKYGMPEDMVITIAKEHVSFDCTNQLLKQCDMVCATGGTPMVRVAYSSGNPAIGVGTGNVPVFVDEGLDYDDIAGKIRRSQLNDYSTGCSTENVLVVHEKVYESFLAALERANGYIIREDCSEKDKLKSALWPKWPANHDLNREIVGKHAGVIARAVGLNAPSDVDFIAVEEFGGFGIEYPFTGEKLSPVVALIKAKDFDDGMDKMDRVLHYMGLGHSCGIYTNDDDKVNRLALRMKVSRIMVNQPNGLSNAGAWWNGMRTTLTLGCSTWGHNSTSDNVTWSHFVNYTTVSWPKNEYIPTDEELFPAEIRV